MLSRKVSSQISLEEEYSKGSITRDDVTKLRSWLSTQPHLPAQYITDLDLILAFHCCGRSTEVTKQLVDLHYTLRTMFQLFKNRALDGVERSLQTVVALPLQARAHDGSAVLYYRLLDPDVRKFVYHDVIKTSLMVCDLWQYEEGTWPGFYLIVDMSSATLGHVTRLDVGTLREFLYYLQEAMLLNLKGLHFLNAPSFMDKVLMIMKPFLKKELMDNLVIHSSDLSTLEKFLPVAALPKDVGGDFITLNEAKDILIEKLKANKEFFEQESLKRVTESRRPGRAKTISDYFGGVEGSFKKLDID